MRRIPGGASAAGVKRIVAVGEALWDVFPDRRRPGGAPCNVAFHAAQLGDHAAIVTRVGADEAGADLVRFLRDRGVDTAYVQRDPRRPTGTVIVTVVDGEPRYAVTEAVAWDVLVAVPEAQAAVRAAEAVVVGTLAQRSAASRTAIAALLGQARRDALVIYDVNLRPPYVDAAVVEATCQAATVVKMNDGEAEALGSLLGRPDVTSWLLRDAGVRTICVTHGPRGATLLTKRGSTTEPGVPVAATGGDAVGAGDAFTAALAHQLVRGVPPETVLRTANAYAALIASRPGAMPAITPEDLRAVGLTPPAPPPRGGRAQRPH